MATFFNCFRRLCPRLSTKISAVHKSNNTLLFTNVGDQRTSWNGVEEQKESKVVPTISANTSPLNVEKTLIQLLKQNPGSLTRVVGFSPHFALNMSSAFQCSVEYCENPLTAWQERRIKVGDEVITTYQSGASMLPISPNLKGSHPGLSSVLHQQIAEEIIQPIENITKKNCTQILTPYGSQQDHFKSTPLILLARTLKEEALCDVIQKAFNFHVDINVNAQDNNGCTVLHYAYIFGLKKAVDILIKYGAKKGIKNNQGFTPESWAKNITKPELSTVLKELEMHPDRDIRAQRNYSVFIKLGNKLYYVLSSKEILQNIFNATDFNSLPTLTKEIVREGIEYFKGTSILDYHYSLLQSGIQK